MHRVTMSSSNLRSVGYSNGTLEVEFHSGGVYQYFDVPRNVYDELMSAASHGIYFHRNIKLKYRWRKVQ